MAYLLYRCATRISGRHFGMHSGTVGRNLSLYCMTEWKKIKFNLRSIFWHTFDGQLLLGCQEPCLFLQTKKEKKYISKTRGLRHTSGSISSNFTLQVEFGFLQFDVGVVFIPREPSAAAGRRQVDVAVPVVTVVVPEATTAVLGAVVIARRIVVSVMRAERFDRGRRPACRPSSWTLLRSCRFPTQRSFRCTFLYTTTAQIYEYN